MIKVQSYYPSYRNLDPSKVSRRVFGYGAEKMQEFMKRKNDTKEKYPGGWTFCWNSSKITMEESIP
jgi:hypothetical protein